MGRQRNTSLLADGWQHSRSAAAGSQDRTYRGGNAARMAQEAYLAANAAARAAREPATSTPHHRPRARGIAALPGCAAGTAHSRSALINWLHH